jgi:hypothetical protein
VLTRSEIITLLGPSPCWQGFDDFIYDFWNVPVSWGLQNLHTCRSEYRRDTFVRTASIILDRASQEAIDDYAKRVLALADSFEPLPLQVPVFLHRDLKIRWPTAYPANTGVSDDALVAEDRNKRLTALGIRSLRGQPLNIEHIGLYVGYLGLLPGRVRRRIELASRGGRGTTRQH